MAENKKFYPTILVGNDENSITNESFLQGLIMRACSKFHLHYPNAFMYKTNIETGDVTKKYGKIQNKVFFEAFASICRKEEVCPSKKCIESDACATEYLLEEGNHNKKQYDIIENIEEIQNTAKTQKGIIYTCKRTGYNEIAFPVEVYGKKLGVFILGQIVTEKGKTEFEIRTGELYKKIGEEPVNVEAVDNLQELIDNIVKAVVYIGKQLEKRYEERQNIYSIERSDDLIKKFKSTIPKIKANNQTRKDSFPAVDNADYYDALGNEIKNNIESLCRSVGLEHYTVFVPNRDNMILDDYTQLKCDNIRLKWGKCMEEHPEEEFVCENVETYFDSSVPYDFMVISSSETYPIALAMIKDELLCDIDDISERHLLKHCFADTVMKFAGYAQMAGLEAKSDYFRAFLDSSMSITRHEIGQSNAGFNALIEKFKGNRELADELSYRPEIIIDFFEQCDLFIKDSERYLQTTKMRIQSTKYLINFPTENMRWFYPYDEFLFKWHQIYYHIAEKGDFNFDFPRVTAWDNTRPRMYGDPLMIEQAAYNLTNNAIKYAIKGSTISMDCSVNPTKNRYEIKVENIGHSLAEGFDCERLFGFGVRGDNNKSEGSGIGLFLTRQIAKHHKGDVEVEVKTLNKYDISLIRPYIEAYEDEKNKNLCKNKAVYESLKKELENNENNINKYITRELYSNAFAPMYVQKNIEKGTSKYTFTFWVPYKK